MQRLLVGPLAATPADIVPLSTGIEQFQLAINAEVRSKGSTLKGRFQEAQVKEGRVRSLSGGRNVQVIQDKQRVPLSISPDTGFRVPESAQAKDVFQKATKEFKLSAAANGAAVSDLEETTIAYQYKARPLNGIWATAPYLHNGSVPTLAELLKKPTTRVKVFFVGDPEFLPTEVGFKYQSGPSKLDTSLAGNSNDGHDYGTDLTAPQREQLLEYLKSL